MSEKMKKSDKVKMSSRPKNDRLNKSDIKKQTWRAGNMLYPVPAVMVSCARKGEKPNIITVAWAYILTYLLRIIYIVRQRL